MTPLREVDGYTFQWPTLSNTAAQDFMLRFSGALMDLTPAQRIEKINEWLPAIQNPKHAAKAGIGAVDQHLVVSALLTWREENSERVSA
jgi:hypothetical protein